MISGDDLRDLVAQAALAPSVHNTQPARWARVDGGLWLRADAGRRLPASDPQGRDLRLSLGTACEAMVLALSRRGLGAEVTPDAGGAFLRLVPGAAPDPLAGYLPRRATWRGGFRGGDAAGLAGTDVAVVSGQGRDDLGALNDRAALAILRDPAQRAELRDWMRLSRRHPDYYRDGMNLEALCMGRATGFAARIALSRRGFEVLDALGLAGVAASDAVRVAGAAAIILFHCPEDEDALITGRGLMRLWLRITAAGLAACPMAALADWPEAAAQALARAGIAPGRRLVMALRVGLADGPPDGWPALRARLPVDELLAPRSA